VATPTATPTAPPSAPAAPALPPATLPGFSCAQQYGGNGQATMSTARVGAQSGYDRFVIEFNGPVPQYDVAPLSSATFVRDPSGIPVTLAGSAGLEVTLRGAQANGTYSGPTDQRPSGTAVLREARQTGDFEGVVHWGLGLSRASCFRAFTLTGPSRLVIDIQG